MRRSVAGVIAGAAGLGLCAPSPAWAHLVTSGLGPFYDGALHLLMSPVDLLGLVAVVFLAGLRGKRASRYAALLLPVCWYGFGLIGLSLATVPGFSWASALSLVVLGALVALDLEIPAGGVAALAGPYGALQGLLNGAALRSLGAGAGSLLGIAVSVLVIGLLVSAAVVSLRPAWARIAVRVAGSWVAAVGMLWFGWLVRG